MDDLKLHGKNDKEIDSLIKTLWQCSEDIKMEFRVLKCAIVSLQRGKKIRLEGIQLPNGEEIGETGPGGYEYLSVLEIDKTICDEIERNLRGILEKSNHAHEDLP